MAGAVEFHEAFAFRIDRSPRVIGRAFKVDIGRQHDSGTLALGNQLDRFFQRSDIACNISRNSTGSFPECNFRNRTVDLHIAFHHVQFSYGNALGDNQGVAGSCGFDSGIARAVQRDSSARIIRDGIVVHEGKLASIQRGKDAVKEVRSGFECGLVMESYNDIKEGDQIESFIMEEVPR